MGYQIKRYRECQKCKSFGEKRGKLKGYIESKEVLIKIASDIYGPLEIEKNSKFEKGYVVSFIDTFSKFTRSYYTTKIKGENLIKAFKTMWLNIFMKPQIFISDNGKQYTSKIFSDFLESNSITHSFTVPYNPTSNSLAERINQTIGNCFRIYRGKCGEEIAENSLNHTYNSTLGKFSHEVLSNRPTQTVASY